MSTNPLNGYLRGTTISTVDMVREFHEIFGHPVSDEHVALSANRAYQRLGYVMEELLEGHGAALASDRVEMLDAMADAAYFSAGSLVEQGVVDDTLEQIAESIFGGDDNQLVQRTVEDLRTKISECGSEGQIVRALLSQAMIDVAEVMAQEDAAELDLTELSASYLSAMMTLMVAVFRADPLEVMTEVHRSNMSKLLPAELDSEDACRAFMAQNGCKVDPLELKFERLDDMRWVAKHIGTEKVIKNPLLSKPVLAPLLDAMPSFEAAA